QGEAVDDAVLTHAGQALESTWGRARRGKRQHERRCHESGGAVLPHDSDVHAVPPSRIRCEVVFARHAGGQGSKKHALRLDSTAISLPPPRPEKRRRGCYSLTGRDAAGDQALNVRSLKPPWYSYEVVTTRNASRAARAV